MPRSPPDNQTTGVGRKNESEDVVFLAIFFKKCNVDASREWSCLCGLCAAELSARRIIKVRRTIKRQRGSHFSVQANYLIDHSYGTDQELSIRSVK